MSYENIMKRLAAIILMLSVCAHAQTNVLYGTLQSSIQSPRTNVLMTLQRVSPKRSTFNGALISDDPVSTYTDVTSAFSFTNSIFGKYSLTASDASDTPWILYVGSNTLGTVAIASLITNSAAVPPNPGTNYYTQSQIDALLANQVAASRTPLTNTAWGLSPSEATNRLQIKYVYTNGVPYYGYFETNK